MGRNMVVGKDEGQGPESSASHAELRLQPAPGCLQTLRSPFLFLAAGRTLRLQDNNSAQFSVAGPSVPH